jgi:NADH:ubiquinone oxidoreductase subunit 6 (subunit J)
VVAAAALLVEIVVVLGSPGATAEDAESRLLQGPARSARSSSDMLAFEITSIVLLVAAIGGVVLGKTPEKDTE